MYSDYLSINKDFQTSINLQLDINNEAKIRQYIPTSDICAVLKEYFSIFLGKCNTRSTFLVGPYGKGKSFLLLILVYLTGGSSKSSTYRLLLTKIKKLDPELADMIQEFNSKKMKLLPVIINSDYKDLNQAFRLALDEALNSHGLDKLVPDSAYRLCLKLLDQWENHSNIAEGRLDDCLAKTKIDLATLRTGLQNYSSNSYQDFRELYRCATMGLEFNPLINDNLSEVFSSTVNYLPPMGYSGIFVIFDEFSKSLENSPNLSMNLKAIQDFAELANRTANDKQITFCCVTHKSLDLYSGEKDKNFRDSLKTVEGRFTEIRFNRSLDENYQIISGAILHKGKKEELQLRFDANKGLYEHLTKSGIFRKDSDFASLFKGCFPLNPLTTLSLIQLSEIVAQNERTLFTFLSDTDESSFSSFLLKNDSGTMNNDSLYDYFNEQLEKDDSEYVRNCWFKAEAALKVIQSPLQRKIIKSLCVIHIINDFGKIPPRADVIALSLNKDEEAIRREVDEMVQKHYLKKSPINEFLSIASSYNHAIEEKISLILKTKLKNRSLSQLADEANEERYYVPRKYNAENYITRFFRVVFMTENEFFALNSFESIFNAEFSDGLLINLIPNDSETPVPVEKVFEKLRSLQDPRLLVRLPDSGLNSYFADELKKFSALKELKKQDELADNTVTSAEIDLLVEEARREINELIALHYSNRSPFATCFRKDGELSEAVAELLEKQFPKAIIFNNELVNRYQASAQYQKSINNVADWVLNGEEDNFGFSPTSAEQTIRSTVIDEMNNALMNKDDAEFPSSIEHLKEVMSLLEEKFIHSPKSGIRVSELSDLLSSSPYGIRKGLHSLLFAKIITSLSQSNVVLKFESKEIDLTADNIFKAVYSTKNYTFHYSKRSKEQKCYLDSLLKLFDIPTSNNFRKDVASVAEQIQRFFTGLPKVIRTDKAGKDFLGLDPSVLNYKDLFLKFNINPYEIVLEKSLEFFGGSYDTALAKISDFKNNWKNRLEVYRSKIESVIREEFFINPNTNLKTGIESWLKRSTAPGSQLALSNSEYKIYSCIQEMNYDDEDNAESMAHAAIGAYPEDWGTDELASFREKLENFKHELKSAKSDELGSNDLEKAVSGIDDDFSTMGGMLRNNLESNLLEYGDSVDKAEKVKILLSLAKELMK